MVASRKRRVLLVAGGLALAGLFGLAPVLINAIILERLDIHGAREKLTLAIESQTGLALTVQGVKYRFLRGLVFRGVRIQPKDAQHGLFVLQAESLMLQLSLLRALRGQMPFTRVLVSEGRINPYALDAKQWNEVLERFHHRAQGKPARDPTGASLPDPATAALSQIEFVGEGLRLVVPEAVMPGGRKRVVDRIRVDFFVKPQERRWTAELYKGIEEGAARIQARGRWGNDSSRRVNFKFSGVPLPLLYILTSRLPLWPAEIKAPLERTSIESGQLDGRGSLDLAGSGVGLNFNGSYTGVRLHIGDRRGFHLALAGGAGAFRYNTAFLAFADGPAQTELEVHQEGLQLRFLQRDVKLKERRENFFEAEVRAKVTRSNEVKPGVRLGLPGCLTEGNVEFFARYTYGRGWIQPELRANLGDFRIHLSSPLFRLSAGQTAVPHTPVLRIAQASLEQKSGQKLKLEATGDLDGAPVRLSGHSESYLLVDPGPNLPSMTFSQDLKGEVFVRKLPYRQLLVPAARIHSSIIAAGSRVNADRAEEHGLLRQYQFMDPVYERAFIANTKVDLRFHFTEMQDAGAAWPRAFDVLLNKDSYVMQVTIPEATGPQSKLSFELTTRPANRPMPYHDIKAALEVVGNHLAFPEFLGNDVVPTEIRGSFRAFGQGWYAYDLITHTYSDFSLEVKHVNLASLQPAVILKYKLQMKEEDFLALDFSIKRRTDLNRFYYYPIEVRTKRLTLRATGEFIPQQGGELGMQYEWQTGKTVAGKPETLSDRLDLVISADEQWAPKSSL